MSNSIYTPGVAFGTPAGAYGARTAVVAGVNTSVKLPQGWHIIECDAHTTCRVTYDGGSNWITLVPLSGVGTVWSDGGPASNAEIRGDATGGTAQRSQILGAA